ncbi:MAG TPA: PD-(D/E)XK nuclease family protein, partial [Thermoplasmata archaeon]|nr:PD-(D/E)XK nuclease family protein [Thermoplasmata archaeon]
LTEAPRGYYSFGRTVHSVLEDLLRPLVRPTDRSSAGGAIQRTLDAWRAVPGEAAGRLMSLAELHALYERAWISEGYSSPQEEARYRALGVEMLEAFRESLVAAPPMPVAVEEHLSTEWNGIPVHGYVDRIDRTPSGGLEILDYKTSKELSHDDARGSDQLGLYQVLVERNFREPVEALTLYHLRSMRPLRVPPRPPGELDQLYGRVASARDGIRAGSFEPTPGRPCARCEFRGLCPEFREVPEAERERLAGLADRFGELRREERRLEAELRRTAEELHGAAEALGVHRIPGSREVLRRRRETTWRFPADSIRPLLERYGVAERVDPDDAAAVARLARDPSADPELRRQLLELAGRRVRWFWELERSEGD